MAQFKATVTMTVDVVFNGTEDQFGDLTREELHEEAVATVKSLLSFAIRNEVSMDLEVRNLIGQSQFYSDAMVAIGRGPKTGLIAALPIICVECRGEMSPLFDTGSTCRKCSAAKRG